MAMPQRDYYKAISVADKTGDAGKFVEFMLATFRLSVFGGSDVRRCTKCAIIRGMDKTSEYEKEKRRETIKCIIVIIVAFVLLVILGVFFDIEPQWGPIRPINIQ